MNVVAYYRVSTARQGQSGLGLEAQREIVNEFARLRGHIVIEEIVEVQSGKDDSRPELARALSLARLQRAGLIVAKLDRLARSARFLDEIVSSGVDVLFCNLPDLPPGPTGKFMVQLMASIAEMEAGMISERTKQALQAAKARGKTLGGFRGTAASPKAREASAKARAEWADKLALSVMPHIRAAKLAGHQSMAAIATHLNEQRIPTPAVLRAGGGDPGTWSAPQVHRIMRRLCDIHQREITEAQTRATSFADWFIGATGDTK